MENKKFPSDLKEERANWVDTVKVGGYTFLKVKPELFTPPIVKGQVGFHEKVIKQDLFQVRIPQTKTLVFDEDF